MRRDAKGVVLCGSAFLLILALTASVAGPQEIAKGDLIGFICGQDGSTPVAGAVVMVKNLTTGVVTEAGESDDLGMFKVAGLDAGIYALGVRSQGGDFNCQDFFGITSQKTAKISVALNRYDPAAAAGAAMVIKEQRDKGEAYVGKVVAYDPATRQAAVLVEIGLIQAEDRIHVKGRTTDFYQDLRTLMADGTRTDRVTVGNTAMLRTSEPCESGDLVYIVCKRGVPPFFLAPLGIAAIVAGAMPLSATFEEEPASPFKIR
ncbi:MAG TPA: carboxypeptidase regulatory-like domain-containing protein [Candidatus Aminicenantes bacterium]|nr:carboxypeptidase regulatory-like domain-containing protein [Candidatus Aminicenantes bacterium]HDT13032.1 carboxypeptidase regulatory-like domain-containing protein [Candidatus Aminicenantes bacterium]